MRKAIFEFIKEKGWVPINQVSREDIRRIILISNRLTKLKRKRKMPIKICTEKLIVNGKRYRGLVAWEDFLPISELPQEYMDSNEPAFYSNPKFHLNSNYKSEKVLLIYCKDEKSLLEAKAYPENEFQ